MRGSVSFIISDSDVISGVTMLYSGLYVVETLHYPQKLDRCFTDNLYSVTLGLENSTLFTVQPITVRSFCVFFQYELFI